MEIKRDFKEDEWVKEISGQEFRDTGLLWFINTILHMFGLAITWNPDTDELKAAIVRYRGFEVKNNDQGYKKVSEYLKNNIINLEKDCE